MTVTLNNLNKYRQGFATLTEELSDLPLTTTGTIPDWLNGRLYRNGPALFELGEQRYRHLFDGLAMIHSFAFNNGNVNYTNRYLRSQAYQKAMETGKLSGGFGGEEGTPQGPSQSGDNTNVSVGIIGGQLVAMTETPQIVKFDTSSLETLGLVKYEDSLGGQVTTAHPHYDFANRQVINYMVEFGRETFYHVYRQPFCANRRELIGSVPVSEPSYMHSFAMTEHYVIMVEFPLVVNPLDLLTSQKSFIENYRWQPERGTHFIVMAKEDGSIQGIYQGAACFGYHQINAFEAGNDIVIDLAAKTDASGIYELFLDKLSQGSIAEVEATTFRRYRLTPGQSSVDYEVLSSESIELPAINYRRYNTAEYSYAYGVSLNRQRPEGYANQLIKVALKAGRTFTWSEEACYPGEPVFVPRPGATSEDDGVVLSVVLDGNTNHSFLLALDGTSFTECGRANLPYHIPFGFHGLYLAGA
ncbi:MAG TPA: carotenoid oxygenase family protein [Chloroflexia bacterium]|nr:carotenoid oxygenase family protein [Chloroflexia bacterium]